LKLTDIGVELAGERAYMTGRLSRARPDGRSAAAKVQRVGLIRKPKLLMGQLHEPGKEKRDIPDTFAIAVQGNVTLTKVFARELERRRCRKWASQGAGPVRAGRAIGRLTAQLLAGSATGLSGTLPLTLSFSTTADDPVPISVTDTNGVPLAVDVHGQAAIALPTAPGNATALGCVILPKYPGQACAPFGTVVALAGGFALRIGDRATTIANLSIADDPVRPQRQLPVADGHRDDRRSAGHLRLLASRPHFAAHHARRAGRDRRSAWNGCRRSLVARAPDPRNSRSHLITAVPPPHGPLTARAARSVRSTRSPISAPAAAGSAGRSATGQNQR
jgi:hypothetical protein